jgi:hypothetical protein
VLVQGCTLLYFTFKHKIYPKKGNGTGKLAVILDYGLDDLRGSNFSRVKTFSSSPERLDGLQFPLSLLFRVGAGFLFWEYSGQGVKMTTLSIQCQGEEQAECLCLHGMDRDNFTFCAWRSLCL